MYTRGVGEPIVAGSQPVASPSASAYTPADSAYCPSWFPAFPGSHCWELAHPGEDPSLLCALGISCIQGPPVLRSAGPPPPISDNGLAPADYTPDDVAKAGADQTQRVLADWWASLQTPPDKPVSPGIDFTTVALLVGGVALFSMLRN